jgi:hypothetical protein
MQQLQGFGNERSRRHRGVVGGEELERELCRASFPYCSMVATEITIYMVISKYYK